jgi:AAA domain
MARVPYDVRNVKAPQPRLKRKAPVTGESDHDDDEQAEAGSFAARITARMVDLVQLAEDGLPPIEYLPASEDMLVRGKRHLIAAPAKAGKSIGMLVHLLDMSLAGATVVVLDRENGSEEYARRLHSIMEARKLAKKHREHIRERLRYYEFPQLRADDADELVAEFATADLVVFDSQRMFLSDLGLKEKESDDYATFMSYVIDPLFRANVATLILDNTGHKETTRGRGTAAKGDLNELLFSMETVSDFDLFSRGQVKLKVEFSRFGSRGEWTMDIGAGQFSSWQAVQPRTASNDDFRAAVEKVLADGRPHGQDKLIRAVRETGVKISTPEARRLLNEYKNDPQIPIHHTTKGYQNEPS